MVTPVYARTRPLVTRSEFEEQRRNRRLTALLLVLGIVWTAGLGFWAVFSHLSLFAFLHAFLHNAVPAWLTNENVLSWCLRGSLLGLSLWLLISLVLSLRSHEAIPKLAGGTRATGAHGARLERVLSRVLAAAGESPPGPKLFLAPGPLRNAFAAGASPTKGSIVVTAPLLEALSDDELEAVLGHELAHLKHRDSTVMVQAVAFAALAVCLGYVAAGFVGLVGLVVGGLIAGVFALVVNSEDESGCIVLPLGLLAVGYLLYVGLALVLLIATVLGSVVVVVGLGIKATASSLAQSREFLADARSAGWTGRPELLASALEKVANAEARPLSLRAALLQPLMLRDARSPFAWQRPGAWLSFVLRTHPPANTRISLLHEISGGAQLSLPRSARRTLRAPAAGRWGWVLSLLATLVFAALTARFAPTAGEALRTALEPPPSAASSQPQEPAPLPTAVVNEPIIRLRSRPGIWGPVAGRLARDTEVEVLDCRVLLDPEQDWCRVRVRSAPHQEGWVAKRLITFQTNKRPQDASSASQRRQPPC